MADPTACAKACQFITPDYRQAEARVHGRSASPEAASDEAHFGVVQMMIRARLKSPSEGAQWTGITTELAADLLRAGKVDAVIAMAPHPEDRWRPVPAIVERAEDLAACRGMRMGYAPIMAAVEYAAARGLRRLAVVAIPCQVYALRALEADLQLDTLHVIGTPCSDNTTTERFHQFLALLSDEPETITYLEFRADYHVELRFADGRQKLIPFLMLPLSNLPSDFFPLTCRTCVDYTNRLADITVGYMGGTGQQWLIVRNARGRAMLDALGARIEISKPETGGRRANAVEGFLANTERAAGGLPLRKMPGWVRPIVAWFMPRIGPRGLEFARARVEMKAIETVLHLRRHAPRRMRTMVPEHVWRLVAPYGLERRPSEDSHQDGDARAPENRALHTQADELDIASPPASSASRGS
ncbi:MAG: Coenzyme F420 hydrogenase/dehydrogenase, beta subunit C-terminal domain [Hyphomicrobiaceae bacterium]